MTEQTEREVFEALFAELHGTKDSIPLLRYTIKWRDRRDHFTTMLNAEAYLDAAMMLVPEGWRLSNLADKDPKDGKATAHIVRIGAGYGHDPDDRHWGVSATSALALCAAIRAAEARAA